MAELNVLHDSRRGRVPTLVIVVAIGGLIVGGCATPPKDDPEALIAYQETNDPYEPLNRAMFKFNLVLDKALLKPLAYIYKEVIPGNLRDMVKNFLDNLETPVILANDLLQGEFTRAGDTTMRFMMNTTFGFLGIADIATDFGIERHVEDFGQTLAVGGVGEGPYLMLPLLGPSNPRDAFGRIVDIAFDPLTYIEGAQIYSLSRIGVLALDLRARRYDELNELERSSLDYYATVRSLYRQSRNDEIRNGVPAALELPDMSLDMDGEMPQEFDYQLSLVE